MSSRRMLFVAYLAFLVILVVEGWEGDRHRYGPGYCTEENCKKLGSCATIKAGGFFNEKESCLTPLANGECIDVSDWWKSKGVAGVDTKGTCAIIYDQFGCKGKKARLDQTNQQFHDQLDHFGMYDKTLSVGSCIEKDQQSGASNEQCKKEKYLELPLFYGSNWSQAALPDYSPSVEAKIVDAAVDSMLTAGSSIPVVGNIISGLKSVMDTIKGKTFSDVADLAQKLKDKNLDNKIDFKAARSNLEAIISDMQHCVDVLGGKEKLEGSENSVMYCFHSLSAAMLQFDQSGLKEASLAAAPVLFELIPFHQVIQLAAARTDSSLNGTLCTQADRLLHRLNQYKELTLTQRKQLFIQERIGCETLIDGMTGQTLHPVKYVSFFDGFVSRRIPDCKYFEIDLVNICRRDLFIVLQERINKVFWPVEQRAQQFFLSSKCRTGTVRDLGMFGEVDKAFIITGK